jgi:hypothetical protein
LSHYSEKEKKTRIDLLSDKKKDCFSFLPKAAEEMPERRVWEGHFTKRLSEEEVVIESWKRKGHPIIKHES